MKKTILTLFIILLSVTAYSDSRLNRGKKDIFVDTTIGLHIPTLLAIPVRVGYFKSPDTMIGLEYASREFEFDDDSVVVENGKITNEGVSMRHFFSSYYDSLNILASFNRRTFEVDVKVNIQDEVETPFGGETKYTMSNLQTEIYTFSLGVGNQWMWPSGIYFGIDWFMPTWILSSSTDSKVTTDNSSRDQLTSDELKRAEDDLDDFGDTVNGIAGSNGYLMITIGGSF